MNFGTRIVSYRKSRGMTQDALAQKLGVTNQAVSKWEADQCCPDVTLLPKLADIFEITLDELFGRSVSTASEPIFADDGVLRVVLFCGAKRMKDCEVCDHVQIDWNGPVQNLQCDCGVNCDQVQGNVSAGGSVNCDEVQGSISAGGSVTCDVVRGDIRAGGNVTCDDVRGSVYAGGNVTCDCIAGSVTAGREVNQR